PIRVGVNAGSLHKDLLEKYGSPVPAALVESAVDEIRLLEEVDFHDIKISVAGIATLLRGGIGDTIRCSLAADPVEEAEAGRRLLEQLGLRERAGLDLIACPSCGRAHIDVVEGDTAAQRGT